MKSSAVLDFWTICDSSLNSLEVPEGHPVLLRSAHGCNRRYAPVTAVRGVSGRLMWHLEQVRAAVDWLVRLLQPDASCRTCEGQAQRCAMAIAQRALPEITPIIRSLGAPA